MKVWNPQSKSFDAVPPLPEFVGRWQVGEGGRGTIGTDSSLARAVLRRARAAVGAFLGLEQADALAEQILTERTPAPGTTPSPLDRIALPMSSGVNILPNTSAQITARPQSGAFRPERIIIGGDPDHWIVSEIKVGRRSQLADSGDLPGAAFAAEAQDVHVRLDVVQTSQNFTMIVMYVGPDAGGAPFSCTAIGSAIGFVEPCPQVHGDAQAVDAAGRIYLPLSTNVHILPDTSVEVKVRPQDPFRPERILIGGDPSAWIVNDVRIGGRSQFAQRGDIPGQAFAAMARGAALSFETAQVAMDVVLAVTYVGKKEEGEPLSACAIGTVPA